MIRFRLRVTPLHSGHSLKFVQIFRAASNQVSQQVSDVAEKATVENKSSSEVQYLLELTKCVLSILYMERQ